MGEQGLVGIFLTCSAILSCEQDIYDYYDHPRTARLFAQSFHRTRRTQIRKHYGYGGKTQLLCVGSSGTLLFQTVDIFRQLAYPAVKRAIKLPHQPASLPISIPVAPKLP